MIKIKSVGQELDEAVIVVEYDFLSSVYEMVVKVPASAIVAASDAEIKTRIINRVKMERFEKSKAVLKEKVVAMAGKDLEAM